MLSGQSIELHSRDIRSSKYNAATVRPITRLGCAHELVHRLSRRWPPRSVSDSRPRAGSSATPSPSRPTETRARPAVNPRQGAGGGGVRRSPWLHGESLGADRGPPLRGEAAVASCALGAVNGGLGDGADEDGAGRPTGAAQPARVGPSAPRTTPRAAPSGRTAPRERMSPARAASPRTAAARPAPREPSPPGRTKRSACPRALARPGRCRPRRAALRRRPSVGPARPEATARAAACPRWRAPRIAGTTTPVPRRPASQGRAATPANTSRATVRPRPTASVPPVPAVPSAPRPRPPPAPRGPPARRGASSRPRGPARETAFARPARRARIPRAPTKRAVSAMGPVPPARSRRRPVRPRRHPPAVRALRAAIARAAPRRPALVRKAPGTTMAARRPPATPRRTAMPVNTWAARARRRLIGAAPPAPVAPSVGRRMRQAARAGRPARPAPMSSTRAAPRVTARAPPAPRAPKPRDRTKRGVSRRARAMPAPSKWPPQRPARHQSAALAPWEPSVRAAPHGRSPAPPIAGTPTAAPRPPVRRRRPASPANMSPAGLPLHGTASHARAELLNAQGRKTPRIRWPRIGH